MLLEYCFICCKPLPDNSTCIGDNSSTIRLLEQVLDIVGISYASFVGELLQGEDCENFNEACSLCSRCCNLIDITADLRRSLLVVKQKFVDRIAAGYQRRPSTRNAQVPSEAKVSDQVADKLGKCFTRSTVIIQPEDEIPLEKLVSLELMIVEPKQELEEVVILDDTPDPFFDESEPEIQPVNDTPPPSKRRKGRPQKSAPGDNLLKCNVGKKLLPSVKQSAVVIDSGPTSTPEESADLRTTVNTQRQTRMSNKKRNEVFESSSETDDQNSSSSEISDSSSSERESEETINLTKRQRRALANAKYRKTELSTTRFRCGKCPDTWALMSKLDWHVKNEHDAVSLLERPFGCAICPAMFHTYEDLKNHVIHYTIAKKHENCLLCEFSDDFPVLTGHYFKEHGLDFLKGKYFGCTRCLRAFQPTEESARSGFVGADDLPAFKSFAEEHRSCSSPKELTVLQKCQICAETRLTAAELISHEITHFAGMYCTLCDFDFKTERALATHNSIFHRSFNGSKTREVQPQLPKLGVLRHTFRCKVCGKWLRSEQRMTAHAVTHAAAGYVEKEDGSASKYDMITVEYECLICAKKFGSFPTKKRHMTWVHNLKLFRRYDDTFYSCFACLAVFEPSDPIEVPGRLLLKDKETFLKFAADHAVCNREPISEFTCTQCQAQFTEPTELFKHMLELASHSPPDEKKNPCEQCKTDFDSNAEYLHHLRQQHSEQIKLKCQCYRCGKHFKDIETLQAHLLESSKQLQCPSCDQNFKGLESYQNHKCKADQVPAPKEVRSTEVPSHSMQLNGGFPCLLCDTTFDSVALLSLHFQEHHDKTEEIQFNCNICSTTLTSSETLRKNGEETFYSTNGNVEHVDFTSLCAQHWKTCTANQDGTSCSGIEEPLFQCYVCHQNQDSPQSLAAHLNEHHGVSEVHRCQACSSIFNKKISHRVHLKSCHNLQSHESDQYYCRNCWEPFHSTDLEMKLGAVAEQDMLRFHTFVDQHFQCKAPKVKPKCRHCSLEFAKMQNLFFHDVRVHSRKHFKYYCERCGKGFADAFKLNYHFELHEIEDGKLEKPTCEICGKTFSFSRYLKRHLATHDKYRPFVCQYCGKGFNTNQDLVGHEKRHLEVKPTEPTVPCPICGKLFLMLRHMKIHAKIHEKENASSEEKQS